MSLGEYLETALLASVFNASAFGLSGDPYISLHTADPGEDGSNEAAGGSYARIQAAFDVASAGATANSGNIDFAGMPAVTLTHVGVWDAASGGNFLWGGALAASKTTNSGDTFRIPSGDLTVTLD